MNTSDIVSHLENLVILRIYLRSKELMILSRQTRPIKPPDCTYSNLLREKINIRNERMLQILSSLLMI